jgi:hypothetical protein
MDDDGQNEQEGEHCHQRTSGIEQKPHAPHVLVSSNQFRRRPYGRWQDVFYLYSGITVDAWEPRTPLPDKEMRNDCDYREGNEARDENPMEFAGFRFGKA